MTKTEFTPEDFEGYGLCGSYAPLSRNLCRAANDKLPAIKAAWLEELKKNAVRVWGTSNENGSYHSFNQVNKVGKDESLYEAYLFDIKEIDKPKIINLEQADKLSVQICGLTLEQVEHLKDNYQIQTGKRAEDL